ncbi:MAG: ERCC4 domain-containing protein [Methanosarcinales archaeon]
MDLIVDVHESGKVRRMLAKQGLEYSVEALEVGDFVVGSYGIERKTMPDLVHSVYSGRLWRQLANLKSNFVNPWLLVQGHLSDCRDARAQKVAISSMVVVQKKFGVPVIRVDGMSQIAHAIRAIVEDKPGQRPTSIHRKQRSLQEIAEDCLCCIPLIGLSKAKLLLGHFGSLRSVFNASRDEILDVRGVGEAIADNLSSVANAPYGS